MNTPNPQEISADDPRFKLAELMLDVATKFCAEHLPDYEPRFNLTLARKKPPLEQLRGADVRVALADQAEQKAAQ